MTIEEHLRGIAKIGKLVGRTWAVLLLSLLIAGRYARMDVEIFRLVLFVFSGAGLTFMLVINHALRCPRCRNRFVVGKVATKGPFETHACPKCSLDFTQPYQGRVADPAS